MKPYRASVLGLIVGSMLLVSYTASAICVSGGASWMLDQRLENRGRPIGVGRRTMHNGVNRRLWRMPATLARLILSMASVLLAAALYFPVFAILEDQLIRHDTTALWVTNLVCGGNLVLAWILIWRSEVSWTPRRRILTALSLVMAAVPAAIVVMILQLVKPHSEELAAIFGVMIWAPCWMGSTAIVWRETRAEREQRMQMQGLGALVCPTCGYNLMGLREAHCPECGSRFTLDQLYAFQKTKGSVT